MIRKMKKRIFKIKYLGIIFTKDMQYIYNETKIKAEKVFTRKKLVLIN